MVPPHEPGHHTHGVAVSDSATTSGRTRGPLASLWSGTGEPSTCEPDRSIDACEPRALNTTGTATPPIDSVSTSSYATRKPER